MCAITSPAAQSNAVATAGPSKRCHFFLQTIIFLQITKQVVCIVQAGMGIHVFSMMHPKSSAIFVLMATRIIRSCGMEDWTVVNCPVVHRNDGSMVR